LKNELNVFLVDDDQITRFLHRKIIESFTQYKPVLHEATNGAEALQLLTDRYAKDKTFPDFILLDIDMPVMGGLDFIEAFQKLEFSSQVQVIIVTTSDDVRDIKKVKSFGLKHYLIKPLTTNLLRTTIMESIGD
jgi:CheY-like chemotaxis protein